MRLIMLYYFIVFSENLNISKAANKLYISEQSLSHNLIELEKYYDTKLFFRQPAMELTEDGKKVLEFAKKVTQGNEELIASLSNYQNKTKINVGIPRIRIKYFLSDVLSAYSQQYPDQTVNIVDASSEELETKLRQHELNVALTVNTPKTPGISLIPIHQEQLFICIPKKLFNEHYRHVLLVDNQQGLDLSKLNGLPLALTLNRTGKIVADAFKKNKLAANIASTSSFMSFGEIMDQGSYAAFFSTPIGLKAMKISDDTIVHKALMKGIPLKQTIYIATPKSNHAPSTKLTTFIDIMKKICTEKAQEYEQEFKAIN